MQRRSFFFSFLFHCFFFTLRQAQIVLCLLVICTGTKLAFAAKIVVVQNPGTENLALSVQTLHWLEDALKQHLEIVPFAVYYKAAQTAHVRPGQAASPSNAVVISRTAGTTHVLFLTPTLLRRPNTKHRGRYALSVLLVDGRTGESLWQQEYTLRQNRLSHPLTQQLAEQVMAILMPKTPPAAAVAPSLPPPTLAPSSPSPPAPPLSVPPKLKAKTPAKAPPVVAPPPQLVSPALPQQQPPVQQPLAAPAPQPKPKPKPPAKPPVLLAPPALVAPPLLSRPPLPPAAPAVPQPAPLLKQEPPVKKPLSVTKTETRPRARTPLRLAVGELIYNRTANVTSQDGTPLPCYCSLPGEKPVFFGRTLLEFDLYPLGFPQQGNWYEGWGFHLAASVGEAKTQALASVQATQSTVWSMRGAISYRGVLWRSPLAIALQPLLGYGGSDFPAGSAFVNTGYKSFFTGLILNIPFAEWGGIVLRGRYDFRVIGADALANNILGVQTTPGLGLALDAGLRFVVAHHLELQMQFSIEQITVPFAGLTVANVMNSSAQGENVTLKDMSIGGQISLGYNY